jgi:hypothetical protein
MNENTDGRGCDGSVRIIAVLRYVEPSSCASGGLKPYLRSGKPCGLDQPGDPSAEGRVTDTPAPQGLPRYQEGLMEIEK